MTIVRVVGPVYVIGLNQGPREVGLLVEWLDKSGYGIIRNSRVPQISSTSAGTMVEVEEAWLESPKQETGSEV